MTTKTKTKLEWCVVELGEDLNWWVKDISDTAHWDVDGLSIIDPRQLAHILDLADPLRDYGLEPELFEDAFFAFKVDKEVGNGKVRLIRCTDSLLESEEPLFVLPNNMADDKSPYADLLDHLTKCRVQMLNDLLEESTLTVDELEEAIRERHNEEYFEGKNIHAFEEVVSILEYTPVDLDADLSAESEPKVVALEEEDFPDLEEDEEELPEELTARWGKDDDEDDDFEDDEEEEDDEDFDDDDFEDDEDFDDEDDEDDEDEDDEDEDDDEEEEEEDDRPSRRR